MGILCTTSVLGGSAQLHPDVVARVVPDIRQLPIIRMSRQHSFLIVCHRPGTISKAMRMKAVMKIWLLQRQRARNTSTDWVASCGLILVDLVVNEVNVVAMLMTKKREMASGTATMSKATMMSTHLRLT